MADLHSGNLAFIFWGFPDFPELRQVIFPVFLLSIPEGGPPVALLALPYVVLGLVGISFYRSYRRRLKENKVFVRTTGITFLLYCSVAIVGALIQSAGP